MPLISITETAYNQLVPAVHRQNAAEKQPAATIRPVPRATVAIARSLVWWRTQRGYLQRELGERADLDRATVQRAERQQPMRLDTLRRLAEALGVEVADLLREPPAD